MVGLNDSRLREARQRMLHRMQELSQSIEPSRTATWGLLEMGVGA
jgi:hypothetical protein